jgi:regulation of enolase protein 1 (concanavalin A-like superfamily)
MPDTALLTGPGLPGDYDWFQEPPRFTVADGLRLRTAPRTDFWQRTHYGFERDNGHVLYRTFSGDFDLRTEVSWEPTAQYDQCGLMVRAAADAWIKVSTEFEDERLSRLGSVVTNLGWSDWATQDVDSGIRRRAYRVVRHGDDFEVYVSAGRGTPWVQIRIAHLHRAPPALMTGLYACSPVGEGFECCFHSLTLDPDPER